MHNRDAIYCALFIRKGNCIWHWNDRAIVCDRRIFIWHDFVDLYTWQHKIYHIFWWYKLVISITIETDVCCNVICTRYCPWKYAYLKIHVFIVYLHHLLFTRSLFLFTFTQREVYHQIAFWNKRNAYTHIQLFYWYMR